MSECDLKRTMKRDFTTSHLHAGGKVEVLLRILGHSDINATYRHHIQPSVKEPTIGT